MAAWEYRVVARNEENALTKDDLNAFGEAEFELISVVVTTYQIMVIGKPAQKHTFHYFFKRLAKAADGATGAEAPMTPEIPPETPAEGEPASPV